MGEKQRDGMGGVKAGQPASKLRASLFRDVSRE